MKKILTILCIVLIQCHISYSQLSNYIFGFSGVFPAANFFKIDIASGNFTALPATTPGISNYNSSTISVSAEEYYLSTGFEMVIIDANSGTIKSSTNLPITGSFALISYNPCDSFVYGIVNNAPNGVSFAKFNLNLGTMTTISALNPGTGFSLSSSSSIDADSGIYIFENGSINGLDINSGQIIFSNPIVNIPGETFSHISLKCSTHEIFGTSANTNAGVKYLSKVDPYTGIVTHVSNPGWNTGIWKPVGGGQCINQLTGNYYYSAAGHTLIGANTTNGNVVFNQVINSGAGELFCLQHFSECNCNLTGINEIVKSFNVEVSPTVFSDFLKINSTYKEDLEIIIYNLLGNKLIEQKFSHNLTLNVDYLNHGIYIYEVRNKSGVIKKGKVVRE